ncbi:hypothetical protein MKX07_001744 [Trichoderma sp. CBMAI-0711]|nr:hypothetical protein MKX07_001744 [Trichoderma sp. CBMAI-0711]
MTLEEPLESVKLQVFEMLRDLSDNQSVRRVADLQVLQFGPRLQDDVELPPVQDEPSTILYQELSNIV